MRRTALIVIAFTALVGFQRSHTEEGVRADKPDITLSSDISHYILSPHILENVALTLSARSNIELLDTLETEIERIYKEQAGIARRLVGSVIDGFLTFPHSVPTVPGERSTRRKREVGDVHSSRSHFLIRPVKGGYVKRGIIPGVHKGVDFVVVKGTEVYASESGCVVTAHSANTGRAGRYIKIRHERDDRSRPYYTLYMHLDRLNVRRGKCVRQGQVIGFSGNTGETRGINGGYHLHFETRGIRNPFG